MAHVFYCSVTLLSRSQQQQAPLIRNPAANDNESWLAVGGEIMFKVLNPYVITNPLLVVFTECELLGSENNQDFFFFFFLSESQTDLKKLNSNFSMNTNIASAFLDL